MIHSLLASLLAAGPCDEVERVQPDPALAAAYARVAREEEAQRAFEAAVAAWRSAAALQPPAGEAEQALKRLCAQARAATELEAAAEQVAAGKCAEALPTLRAARASSRAVEAALLEGTCEYELGDDRAAIEALTAAADDPRLQPAAELYLGLISLRRGDRNAAALRFGTVAQGEGDGLRRLAGQLLEAAGRRPRLVLEGSLEAGYDSNATLKPWPTVLPGGDDAAVVAGAASLTWRPFEANGPFVAVGAGYRKYLRRRGPDVGLATGSLGWQLAHRRATGSADYGVDFISLEGSPWVFRQRATARVLLAVDPLTLGAEYVFAWELPLAVDNKDYRGFRHSGAIAAQLNLGRLLLELSVPLVHFGAAVAERSSIESGGELRGLIQPGASWIVSIGAGARGRVFEGKDPDFELNRTDLQLDGQLRLDWNFAESLSFFAMVEGRRIFSNVQALSHTRLGASAGLRLWLGLR